MNLCSKIDIVCLEKRAVFDLVSHATEYFPQRVIKIRKFYKNKVKNKYSSYTDDKDVAFIINTRMTKNSYHQTRLGAKNMRLIYILRMIELS
jgi:hypothetical protein